MPFPAIEAVTDALLRILVKDEHDYCAAGGLGALDDLLHAIANDDPDLAPAEIRRATLREAWATRSERHL